MKYPTHTKFDIEVCIVNPNLISENNLDWSTGYGTFHIDQIDILGNLYQIWYLSLYTNS